MCVVRQRQRLRHRRPTATVHCCVAVTPCPRGICCKARGERWLLAQDVTERSFRFVRCRGGSAACGRRNSVPSCVSRNRPGYSPERSREAFSGRGRSIGMRRRKRWPGRVNGCTCSWVSAWSASGWPCAAPRPPVGPPEGTERQGSRRTSLLLAAGAVVGRTVARQIARRHGEPEEESGWLDAPTTVKRTPSGALVRPATDRHPRNRPSRRRTPPQTLQDRCDAGATGDRMSSTRGRTAVAPVESL